MSRFALATLASCALFVAAGFTIGRDARDDAPNVCRATVAHPCIVKFPPRTAEDRFEIDYRGTARRV